PSLRGGRGRGGRGGGSRVPDPGQYLFQRLDEATILLRGPDGDPQGALHAEARHGSHDDAFLEEPVEDLAGAAAHVDQDEVGAGGSVLEPHGGELVAAVVATAPD